MRVIERRLEEIMSAAARLADAAKPWRLHLRIEPEVEKLGYFAKPFDLPQGVALAESADAPADLALFTQHGLDVAPAIWSWRQKHPDGLVLLWAWDNHLGQLHNLHSALSADIVFPSHEYAAGNLMNPVSLLGPHLPACQAQWLGEWLEPALRSDRLMVHYVDYPWATRTNLLALLQGCEDWADLRRLPPGDKRGYFSQTPSERLQDWLSHKTSLVLPVDRDLSTRFFDALYAGQIPVLAGDFADLDLVVSRQDREALGVVQAEGASVEAVRKAHLAALAIFDQAGRTGIERRRNFVLSRHMLRHRIEAALALAVDLAQGRSYQPQFNVAPAASGFRLASR